MKHWESKDYRKVNESFRRRLVYHVGNEYGFFVELKYFTLLLLGTVSTLESLAQMTVDTIQYRFVYDVQMKTIEGSTSLDNDEHWLDIGKKGISSYYSNWKVQRLHLIDSIMSVGGTSADVNKEAQKKALRHPTSIMSFCVQNTLAQLTDGFYHIKNADTGRYLSINDTDPQNYKVNMQSGSVNLAGIRTYLSFDSVAVSPSCVIFVKQVGEGKYDLAGQGSSIYEMSNNRFTVNISPAAGDTFILSGTYSGFYKELMDRSPSEDDGYIMGSGSSGMNRWLFLPINTTDEYIGIRPDVKTNNGGYFGTIYAGFNFRLASPGMAAFYVNSAGGAGFTYEEIKDEVIPAGVPVIIRCTSANPADNKIEPVAGSYDFNGGNLLSGVYCSLVGVAGHTNVTSYNPGTMRVLGLSDKGDLAFVNAKNRPELLVVDKYGSQYLRSNKAYLKVSPGDADVMTIGGSDGINDIKSETKASGIFTLTGVRLPEGTMPKAGIYIENGKKRIAH